MSESYHHESVPPMEMGRAFLNYRERFGVSQQELARRTGITPGTIHHYESLVRNLAADLGEKVRSGELTFKEGRSIADIEGADRQREIAEPFVSGRLSSVYVEKVVGHAKKNPGMPIEQILEDVLKGTRAEDKVRKEAEPTPKTGVDISKLESSALQLAGELDAMQLQVIPEYRRLNTISALRILDSKVQGAMLFLSGGLARENRIPRPLIRTVK
ncbi:MAG: helix-turn-helix transcriptional regulator [Chloroflexi bacterium]|nr:helix-turn-helix transcriptional regulator [Chloroflexota bacterium]